MRTKSPDEDATKDNGVRPRMMTLTMTHRLTAGLLAAIVMTAPAVAQEAPLRLTIAEAIAQADKHSHRIAALQARVDAADAARTARDAADRPMMTLQSGYTRTNHVDEYALALPGQPLRVLYPDVPDNYRGRVDLQWPIFSAGRTGALERAAEAERNAAAHDVVAARADLRLEVVRAFWALVTARQAEDVVTRAVDTIDAHVADLRVRLDQGLIPPNDILSAEAQRSRQQLLAIEARNLRRVADADLRRLIGAVTAQPIDPVVLPEAARQTPPQQPGTGPAPDPSSQAAAADRAERQAFASRVAAARHRETAAAAGSRPQVALGAGYDYARPNPRIFPRLDAWRDSWDVSINVNWTVWDGGRRRAEEAEAAAATRGLLARAADFDRDLAFEIEQRRLEAESAQAAIAAAEDGVRAAVEARRVVGERFTAGVATNTEVLDAQSDVLQAELDRTRAIANARLTQARLSRALGGL